MEGVDPGALEQVFGYSPSVAQNTFTPYLNSLAFRAQGIKTEIQYQPTQHIFLHGGYTYLDAIVLRSFSSDAFKHGFYNNNPNFPNIPIGAEGPLVGARPFRRPPHTGFFAVQYTRNKFGAAIKGALADRSDDSTFLDGFDTSFGDSLVLPNRDLDFGYAKLDLGATFVATRHVTVFTQLLTATDDIDALIALAPDALVHYGPTAAKADVGHIAGWAPSCGPGSMSARPP